MSVVSKLDEAFRRNPDPDAMVRALNNNGWVKGSEFTPALYGEWYGRMNMVGHFNLYEETPRWTIDGEYRCNWGLDYVLNNLSGHYFVLLEDYVEGEEPCSPQ